MSTNEEPQTLLEKAMSNDATSAAILWAYISRGEVADSVALAWLRHVAPRIVTDVVNCQEEHSSRRADAALKAVGLSGRIQRTRWIEGFAAFVEEHAPDMTHESAAQVAPMMEMDPINPAAPYDPAKAKRVIQRVRAPLRKRTRKKLRVPPKE